MLIQDPRVRRGFTIPAAVFAGALLAFVALDTKVQDPPEPAKSGDKPRVLARPIDGRAASAFSPPRAGADDRKPTAPDMARKHGEAATDPEDKPPVSAQSNGLRTTSGSPLLLARADDPKPAAPGTAKADEKATTDPEGLPSDSLAGVLHFYDRPGSNGREYSQSGIYPKAGSNEKHEYFLRPILGRLSIDADPSPTPGMKSLRIRYALSSPQALEAATNELLKKWGINARLWAWPTTGQMVYALKTRTNQPVAKAIQTVGSREQIEFVVDVTDKVASTIEQHPELFVADVYYATRTLNYAKATLSIKGSQNIGMYLRDILVSRDPSLEGKADLTGHLVIGDEIAELERRVAVLAQRSFEVEHPDALPLLREQIPVLIDRVVARLGTDDMDYDTLLIQMNRDVVNAALYRYLLPRVKLLNKSSTGDKFELKLDEKSKTKNEGGGLSIVTSIIGGVGAKETTEPHARTPGARHWPHLAIFRG